MTGSAAPDSVSDVRGLGAHLWLRSERLRLSLAVALFRSEPDSRSLRWAGLSPLVLALGAFLAYQRVGVSNHVLWAEDASVFFRGEHDHGYLAVVTQSFQGYELILPRTIALVATAFPLRELALEYSVMCALVTGFIAMVTARAAAAYGAGRLGGAAIGLLVPLTPIALFESLDVAANIQWFLAGGCFWALLWAPRERRWIAASSLLALSAITTAPLALVFAPLALVRLLLLRGRHRIVTFAYAAGAASQLAVMLSTTRANVVHPDSFLGLVETVVVRLYTLTWLGVTDGQEGFARTGALTAVLVGALWVAIIACCLLTSRARWLLAASLLGATAMFVISAYLNYTPAVVTKTHWRTVDLVVSGRYANSPTFILASGAVCALLFSAKRSKLVLPVLAVAVVLLSVSVVRDFRYPAPRQGGTSWSVSYAQESKACQAQPQSTQLIDAAPGTGYDVSLPCSEILANP